MPDKNVEYCENAKSDMTPFDGFGPIETRTYVYRKGTKIYFKE